VGAQIIDGKTIAAQVRGELKSRVQTLTDRGTVPHLAVILVGDNPASQIYVRGKARACEKTGIRSTVITPEATVSQREVLDLVDKLNHDESVHGILVQLPLPAHLKEQDIIELIDPAKDVDGFEPRNVGRLALGMKGFVPCTPRGIVEMLQRSGISIEGRDAVVLGRSNIVGRPLANLLSRKAPGLNATVTLCHSGTANMEVWTKRAEILVSAMGIPEFVKGNMVREGAVVVDVGMNRVEDPTNSKGYRLVGDVEFSSVSEVASAITPVPGGVGPMTIAMLLNNCVEAAECLVQSGKSKVES
jgi:methylenetetrahydrofolate dehydrogenase (NADP+)/methenyltetrahydrofolate cyclohydrolase